MVEIIPPKGAMPNLAIGTPFIKGVVVGQSEVGEVVVEASAIGSTAWIYLAQPHDGE